MGAEIVEPGATVTYEIEVKNQGNIPSKTYDVLDQIPAGMSFVSASDGGLYFAAQKRVSWNNLTNLEPGESRVLTIQLKIEDPRLRPFRNWSEITDDSSGDYGFGETDEDSTPDCMFQGRLSQ